MENDTEIYQRQNNFTKSALRERNRDARCARGESMEWVIVGMELGVALVIAVAIYITMKK
jgi:hypothetical protein